jgi:hypothetical protein
VEYGGARGKFRSARFFFSTQVRVSAAKLLRATAVTLHMNIKRASRSRKTLGIAIPSLALALAACGGGCAGATHLDPAPVKDASLSNPALAAECLCGLAVIAGAEGRHAAATRLGESARGLAGAAAVEASLAYNEQLLRSLEPVDTGAAVSPAARHALLLSCSGTSADFGVADRAAEHLVTTTTWAVVGPAGR